MTSQEIGRLLSQKVKLVRVEFGLSQEKMAGLLGLSKKTLIQVEKGRSPLTWSAAVTLCALFDKSEVLRSALGDVPLEVIRAVVFLPDRHRSWTMGGRIWWREVRSCGGFRLQQNLVSGHYRILDSRDRRWHSTFELSDAQDLLDSLVQPEKGEANCLQQ